MSFNTKVNVWELLDQNILWEGSRGEGPFP